MIFAWCNCTKKKKKRSFQKTRTEKTPLMSQYADGSGRQNNPDPQIFSFFLFLFSFAYYNCSLGITIYAMFKVKSHRYLRMKQLSKYGCPFDRTHAIDVVFQSRGFYDVSRVLIADARSFQVFAAILNRLTHLTHFSCCYRSDARQDQFRLFQAALL